jgi:hypothetical protein
MKIAEKAVFGPVCKKGCVGFSSVKGAATRGAHLAHPQGEQPAVKTVKKILLPR